MEWVVNVTPRPLYPQKRLGTHCIGGCVGPRAGLDGCEKSRPQTDSIPGPPTPWHVALLTTLSVLTCTYRYLVYVLLFGGRRSDFLCVFLYILCDVQWKCVEGSDCGLMLSAVPTFGSVDFGNLPKISAKLFEFSPGISFDRD